MSPPRIALVWPNFQATNACGIRGRSFARSYSKLGARVHVYAPPQDGFDADTDGYDVTGLPLLHDAGDLRAVVPRDRALRTALRDFQPQVIHASTPSILTAWQASRAARSLGVPFVADVRDLFAESWRAAFGPKRRYDVLERFVEGPLYRGADAVFAVSGIMQERIRDDYAVDASRVHVVPNGADVDAYAGLARAPDVDVLFVGALQDKGRRGEELVAAYERILAARPGTTFRFVGWADSAYAGDIVKLMKETGVREHVELVDRVPHSEVKAHLARARIGVVPLQDAPVFRTAMGAKTYEYLAAGLPLAVLGPSGDAELRRLVDGEQLGVYAARPGPFADRVVELLDDALLLAATSDRARKVAHRFDRAAIAHDAFTRIIEPLAMGKRPEPALPGGTPS